MRLIGGGLGLGLGTLFLAIAFALAGWAISTNEIALRAGEFHLADDTPQPVDDDMHHFMEYVFEPNYKRLQAAMADPKDNAAWKSIKGDSLTLAECANLLLLRAPDKDGDAWRTISKTVRTHGSELYQAARAKDDAQARRAYTAMIKNCNRCHTQFADGEHQLEP